MTTISVEKLVKQPKQKLQSYIFNISNFESWWSDFNAYCDKPSETITFSPIRFFEIQLKLITRTENEVQFDYSKSPFKGIGIWSIKECNEFETLVNYTIWIKGNNLIIDNFIKSAIFRWKHKRDILKLLNKLDQI